MANSILIQNWFPFACFGISVMMGLVMQPFIVFVNIIDWLKGRAITGADKIITSLEISKVFFHVSCLLYFFAMFYFPESFTAVAKFLSLILHSTAFSNILLSTLLSIFFYVKIATFHNVFFLRMKAIISRKLIHLIIASALWSVGYASMYFMGPPVRFLRNSTQSYISDYRLKMKTMSHFNLLWNIFPCVIVFLASALLIITLGFHVSRRNNLGHVTSNTDAYCRTINFTGVSFMIWALYFITITTEGYTLLLDPLWLLSLLNIFPALHSVLLIYVATKLRNQFFKIVHYGTDCLFNRQDPGPCSRGVEVIPN